MRLFTWTVFAVSLVNAQATQCAPARSGASSARPSSTGRERLQVDSLYQNGLSGFHQAIQEVVRDSAQWSSLWGKAVSSYITRKPSIPAVDFSSHMVVVIGTGSHSVNGFEVRIDSAVVHDSVLTVYWADVGPGPSCIAGSGPSWPAMIVKVPRRAEPVRFEARVLRTKCG